MKKWNSFDLVQILGSLASIGGLYVTVEQSETPVNPIGIGLLVLGFLIAVFSAIKARRDKFPKVGRDAMIATGQRLIEGTKTELILFGGDMSWAHDYQDSVRSISLAGKKVKAIYPKNTAPKVLQNARLLQEAGAELVPTEIDSGLRAILVDPNDSTDALLFVAKRTLKPGGVKVETGDKGTNNYVYIAKVYNIKSDEPLMRAVTSLYHALYAHQKQRT